MCYHCKNRGHLKANYPDRRTAIRKPWEQTWKTRKRKRHQNTGGGNAKKPSQNVRQETETIQNLVELTDTELEKATTEDWSMFMNALKIVKVDRMLDGLDAARRTNLCTLVLEHLAANEGTSCSNRLHQPHQVAVILIIEEDKTTRTRVDQFI